MKIETDDLIYLSGFTYYNTSIYYFGGGYYISEYIIFNYLPNPVFGKIDMADVCENYKCKIIAVKAFIWIKGFVKNVLLELILK